MNKSLYTVIVGTGSYIPEGVVKNSAFLGNEFFEPKNRQKIDKDNQEIIDKFNEITNIRERRWASDDQLTSDLGTLAARDALTSSGIDPESIDFLIVAHNVADIEQESRHSMLIPHLAARVKHHLGMKKTNLMAFDILAGCPGWVQGLIVGDALIKSGKYKRGMIIGADTISRVSDPHDRDMMIFADGAGAVIVDAVESEQPIGVLSHAERTDAMPDIDYLVMGPSINPDYDQSKRFLNMQGHKVYIYALQNVPAVAKEAIDKAGLVLQDIRKVLIHQANEKMDEAICQRLMKLYKIKATSHEIMPMTISTLGNTSAATVPTMYDLIKKGKLERHHLSPGDTIVFTSVGAGMNINAVVYREV